MIKHDNIGIKDVQYIDSICDRTDGAADDNSYNAMYRSSDIIHLSDSAEPDI